MAREYASGRAEFTETMMDDFLTSLGKLLNERKKHSVYYMDLLCSSGAVVGFDYYYATHEEGLLKVLDLGRLGKIEFLIYPDSGYARVITQDYKKLVKNMLSILKNK